MNILITGISGFVGRYVADEALRRDHSVWGLTRDISSVHRGSLLPNVHWLQGDLASAAPLALSQKRIDVVIHLATAMQGAPAYQYQVGINGTSNLLNAMSLSDVPRLVLVSSFAVLDLQCVQPMSMVGESVPSLSVGYLEGGLSHDAFGVYATTKARQEQLVADAVERLPDFEAMTLRPGLVYDEQRLINGHAGFFKGGIRVLINHEGQVPVVQAGSLANAIVLAAESQGLQGCLHLVDDSLPSQAVYWAGLRRRSLLAPGGLTLNWRSAQRLARTAIGVGSALGVGAHVPEAFLPGSFASRFKPFRYSNTQARQHLGWQPGAGFF